jgi:hypothetical protein
VTQVQVSEQSMMPEGLLNALDEQGVRDLFAYLRQARQVPTLVTELTASSFFNGSDLAEWHVARGAWTADSGAITGRSSGKATSLLISGMIASGLYTYCADPRHGSRHRRGDRAPWTG